VILVSQSRRGNRGIIDAVVDAMSVSEIPVSALRWGLNHSRRIMMLAVLQGDVN